MAFSFVFYFSSFFFFNFRGEKQRKKVFKTCNQSQSCVCRRLEWVIVEREIKKMTRKLPNRMKAKSFS